MSIKDELKQHGRLIQGRDFIKKQKHNEGSFYNIMAELAEYLLAFNEKHGTAIVVSVVAESDTPNHHRTAAFMDCSYNEALAAITKILETSDELKKATLLAIQRGLS